MKRDLSQLTDREHDIVIIGGGVYGLATAWDAALRGLRVALVERKDFGHATSAASLKLIHGGLRYLQHLDIARMRGSIAERRRMMFMAPHLIHPLEFVIPCYGHGMKGPEIMRAALLMNDMISFDRNEGLDPHHALPSGLILSSDECLDRVPGLGKEGLTGGAVFYDAQMYNSERMTLSFALSAALEGAALANYAEVQGFKHQNGRIQSITVLDQQSGNRVEVAGKLFINMTGPWSDITTQLLRSPAPSRSVARSKGIQLITRSIGNAAAFAVESKQKDTTAMISRGGRNYFVTPWRGCSYIGTTDTHFEGDPDEFKITADDVGEFAAEINQIYPAAALADEDVRFWSGGLRPLGEETTDASAAKASHRYDIRDHHSEGVENLISVIGVKYTICRAIAQQAVDRALSKLGMSARPCKTISARLTGGNIDDFDRHLSQALARDAHPEPVMRHLALNYGSDMQVILDLARQNPAWNKAITGSNEVLGAEIIYAVREEMALSLSDVVMRRTDLGTLGHPGRPALDDCSKLMAGELGWKQDRVASEISEVEALYRLS